MEQTRVLRRRTLASAWAGAAWRAFAVLTIQSGRAYAGHASGAMWLHEHWASWEIGFGCWDKLDCDNSAVNFLDWYWHIYSHFIWQGKEMLFAYTPLFKCVLSLVLWWYFNISSYLFIDWTSVFCDCQYSCYLNEVKLQLNTWKIQNRGGGVESWHWAEGVITQFISEQSFVLHAYKYTHPTHRQ